MTTEHLSSAPGDGTNEDLVRVFEAPGCTDILVLDGATSLADAHYVDPARGDVAWFVASFADALATAIGPGVAQAQAVERAIGAVGQAYRRAAGGQAVPAYAQPLAAMTWIRIQPGPDHLAVSLYCLGDCKAFAVHADGAVAELDPYANPYEDVLQDALAALAREGVHDAGERRARLLPMLRARRASQHAAAAPEALCLAPQGPFRAREHALRLPHDTAVLAMTDGFYRLADPYGLMSFEDLGRRCRREGVAALMRELRQFEAARLAEGALAVKRADDASAVIWTALPQDFSLKDRT